MRWTHRSSLATPLWIASVVASSVVHAGSPGSAEDVQAITAIEMAAAGETNVDKVLHYYAPKAVVADFMTPGWYDGKDQIRAAFQPQLAAVKAVKFHIDEINVASDGNFACAALLIRFNAITKAGPPLSMAVRQLDAFKKIDGSWRIIQQHVSVPADPKTGNAIMNGPLHARGPITWASESTTEPAPGLDKAGTEIRQWLEANIIPTTVDGAIQTYGPTDDVIVFDVSSADEHRGLGELRAFLAPLLAGTRSLDYKIPAFTADSDGHFAVQLASLDLKINMQDGTSQFMSFRQSDCLRKVDGSWHSFLEMGSFPIDAKTGKAIMANPAAFK